MMQSKTSGFILFFKNLLQNRLIMLSEFHSHLGNRRYQKLPNSLPCWAFSHPALQNIPSPYITTPCWNCLSKPTSRHVLENLTWKMFRVSPFGDQHGPSQGHTWGLGAPPSSCSGELCRTPWNLLQEQDWDSDQELSPALEPAADQLCT